MSGEPAPQQTLPGLPPVLLHPGLRHVRGHAHQQEVRHGDDGDDGDGDDDDDDDNDDRYAITAMHCVEGAVNLVVSLGEHSISSNR